MIPAHLEYSVIVRSVQLNVDIYMDGQKTALCGKRKKQNEV